ncbi:MAG: ArnT family glycosyltransferase [Fimbriimonadaceae bacterium]
MPNDAPATKPQRELIPTAPVWPAIFGVAALTLIIHLLCINGYGYFRDELYYLACANRLDWGYVDHPPLSVAILKLFTSILGPELWAVRVPGILASIGTVILYGLIAARLGADRLGQTLACLFAGLAPVCAVVTHLYSMNGIDITIWAAAALLWLKADQDKNPKLWLYVGLICGIAMLNKLSGAWLVAGVGLSTLFSYRRIELKSIYPWLAIVIAFIIFFPHFIWQQEHGWITQEFVRNAAEFKMVAQPPWIILGVQVVVTNPVLATLWILGIYAAIKNPKWRPFAVTYFLVITILLISMRSRENYPAPAYIFVVPFGAIVLSEWLAKSKARLNTYAAAFVLSSIFCLALALPLLPPTIFEKVVNRIVSGAQVDVPASEVGKKSPLQGHADMFGWPKMARVTYKIWESLPEEERNRTPVFGMNYGESAAIWFNNRDKPNFKVIGRHNEYWLWGPGDWDGQSLIVVGTLTPQIENSFESCLQVAQLNEPWAVPEESHAPITILRGLKKTVPEFWQEIRHIQ